MPTILVVGPYRFYFFSGESKEPPHVHIERDGFMAKFWLEEISLAMNRGFRPQELNKICELIEKHQKLFLDKWHEHFKN
ncbi:MAG TPA: DUF4160 domain-containing protein [Chlamydiales bacterium]|nr:DUF4160 domain-containing protein [Chlamydiales bacterium]